MLKFRGKILNYYTFTINFVVNPEKVKNILILLFCAITIMSCTRKLAFHNHTGKEISTIVFLNEEDVTDYSLTYDEIIARNELTSGLLQKDNITFEFKKDEIPYCIYYENTDYESYMIVMPEEEKLDLASSQKQLYKSVDYMVDVPSSVTIKIDNQSDYYIQYVIIHSPEFPEQYYVLNSWNLIAAGSKQTFNFNAFEEGNSITSIELIGYKNKRKLSRKFTTNLDQYLVFKK